MSNWYSHKFRIERPDPANTLWWIDIFLFDTVVRDCLTPTTDIIMWRIHRRSAGGESGHQFSFYYYATHEMFESVKSSIIDHQAVKILNSANLLRDLLHNEEGSEIEATCDPSWPLSLRKSWPYYIMGVSKMALELIENLRPSPRPALDVNSIHEYERYYSHLMFKQNEVWQNFGSHAFFHHINAIFGYVPLIARPSVLRGILTSF